jgi:ABC-type multidrug transport system fused ATPase/permease subunit
MFQHNIQFIEEMNDAELEYMESCCLGVCYVSIVLLGCLLMITQDLSFYWKSFVYALFTYGKEIFIFIWLIMITVCWVIIIINTVTEYTYKIDRTIDKLNETIKEKNNKIQELENKIQELEDKIHCANRKMINFTL